MYMDLAVIVPSQVGQGKKKKTNTIIAGIIKLMPMNQVSKEKKTHKIRKQIQGYLKRGKWGKVTIRGLILANPQ